MENYNYTVKELVWSLEYRSITAKSLADAKSKIAEDHYHEDSTCDNRDNNHADYHAGEGTLSVVGGWDELQDETIYPIIVLHRSAMFMLNSYFDIFDNNTELRRLPHDLRKHVRGESTMYTYLSPEALTKVMGA